MSRMEDVKDYTGLLNSQVMNQNEALHCDVKGYMAQLDQKQRKYLDGQF